MKTASVTNAQSNRVFVMAALVALMASATSATGADDVRIMAGNIEDHRSAGFFAGLSLELSVMGDVLASAKSLRSVLITAVDDTGRNLLNDDKGRGDFEAFDRSNLSGVKLALNLKNPARKALHIKELSGEVQIFVPSADADSCVVVEEFRQRAGTPLSAPSLKANGLEITIWTKEQYDARKQVEAERLKREAANKSGNPGKESAEGLKDALNKMFGGIGEVQENSITFQIKDPQSRLAKVEFEDGKGKAIRPDSWYGGDKRSYHFEEKLPDTARIKLYVATPKSLIRKPFTLTNLPLP